MLKIARYSRVKMTVSLQKCVIHGNRDCDYEAMKGAESSERCFSFPVRCFF